MYIYIYIYIYITLLAEDLHGTALAVVGDRAAQLGVDVHLILYYNIKLL